MKSRALFVFCLLLAALLIGSTGSTFAGLGSLKDKVKKKVENKTEEKAEKAVDDAVDNKGGEKGAESGEAEGGGEAASSGGEAMKPGEGVWVNYDFIPGDRVVFFEDFSKTGVGDFPQRLQFVEGNMEVAEWRGQRWLRAADDARFEIPLNETLPQRFTIEFDYYGPTGQNTVQIYDGSDLQEENQQIRFFWYLGCGLHDPNGGGAMSDVTARAKEKVARCRIMGDGKYIKVYVNDKRVANVPNSTFGRSNSLPVKIWASESDPTMLTNFRIAEGGKKITYDQLLADGKVVTQGILFASGSDVIQPESTPTLKEIGTMLKDHSDLKISIEGHTDNVGEDAGNQTLSDKRAASVKAYLMEKYGIDAARLETKGYGETKPVASNDTPEGRQNNRRVELVKL